MYELVAHPDDIAAFNLAESYEFGKGVKMDISLALKWYTTVTEKRRKML